MQVLVVLAAHADQVVTKERLIQSVWPDTFVTDDVLTRAISELRRVFGDDAKHPRFIQTIPKSGYRLIAHVFNTGAGQGVASSGQAVHLAVETVSGDGHDFIAPVAVVPASPGLPPAPSPALPIQTRAESPITARPSWRGRLIAGVLAVAVGGLVTWAWQRTRTAAAVGELQFKAAFYRATWGEAEIRRSIDYSNRAIALDPNAAESYGGLAAAWLFLSDLHVSPRVAMPHARAAAEQVLRLDETLAQVHITLGLIKLQYDWDFAGADREFAQLIELAPDSPYGLLFRGWLRMAEGRLPEAQADMRRAVAMDSSDEISLWSLGLSYYFAGRYEEAIEEYRRAIAVEPRCYWAHLSLGWAYERQGRLDDAIGALEQARRVLDTPQVVAALVHAQATAGRRAEAQATMTRLLEYEKRRYASPYDLATAFAGLGDRTETLAWLEKAYEERSGWLALWLKIDPAFESLRDDDQFRDLLRRVGHAP